MRARDWHRPLEATSRCGDRTPARGSRRSDISGASFSFAPWPARTHSEKGDQTRVVRSRGRFAGAGIVAVALAGCGVKPVAPNVDIPGIPNPDVRSHLAGV